MSKGIPTVDLAKFNSGDEAQRKEFIHGLGQAFHQVGFVAVVNHGIDLDLVDHFYQSAETFFGLPKEVKSKYEIEGLAGQRGYTSFGKEHAKQSNVGDLKEFYQIGQRLPDDHASNKNYPANVYVDEVQEFTELGDKLYRSFEESGAFLLRAIALHLGLQESYFDEKIEYGNSILRAIHYPPITEEPESAIRAEQHEDINLITLLVGASAGGLQLLNKQMKWSDIQPEENEIVVNVGDMLQRLTNDYLKSTTHRVVNPPRELWHTPRLSIPFFLHPKSNMDLSVLESCVTDERPKLYEPITAGEYLDERLREIGLKK
ncbi:MAG TPA: 2-oxoglutarate and iron-dependent oxygenase domain-containing protein [Saprospiraceae bacterium]|nr:2-oxoglutarate and iron-dependent oxygenase domain-containing protein [Saprospiraceae bacterium]